EPTVIDQDKGPSLLPDPGFKRAQRTRRSAGVGKVALQMMQTIFLRFMTRKVEYFQRRVMLEYSCDERSTNTRRPPGNDYTPHPVLRFHFFLLFRWHAVNGTRAVLKTQPII